VAGPLPQWEASPDGRCRQNRNGSSAEPVLSRVACPTVPLQPSGWRSGDRSQRMGPRSHPLWEWRPEAVCPGRRGGVAGLQCLLTVSGWAAGLFVPCAEGWPRARRRWLTRSRVDSLPSSEAEMVYPPEGRSATLERGGDCPAGPRGTLERGGDRSAGSRGMRMGRTLDFLESFPFFRMGSRPWAFVGPVTLTGVCVF